MRRGNGGRRNDDGFTMTELLVTMLILAMTMVGLAALQLQTINQVTTSRQASEATRLAETVVSRYLSMDFANLNGQAVLTPNWEVPGKQTDSSVPMHHVGSDGEKTGPYTVQRLLEANSGRVLITVKVSWIALGPGGFQGYLTRSVTVAGQKFP